MNFSSVSIIVVNYNGAHLLKDCFNSLGELDYPRDRLELIMVDNGSSDNSLLLMKENFPGVKLIENKKNLGFAEPNNIAASYATGEYLAFINNDMKASSQWLKNLVSAISKSNKDVVCVGSKILNWEGDSVQFLGGGLSFDGRGFELQSLPQRNDPYPPVLFACGGAMLIRRDVFLELGGFDPRYFAYFEDVDLGWRLWITGYRILLVPDSIVYHRYHQTGNSIFSLEQKIFLGERNCFYTIIKNYEESYLKRIFPSVLLLKIKRMLLTSKLNRSDWIVGYECNKKNKSFYDIIKEFLLGIRDNGLSYVFRRKYYLLPSYLERIITSRYVLTPKPSMGSFLALEEVMNNLDYLFEKRNFIQSRRKRSDKEIFKLFRDPFNSQYDEEEYMQAMKNLIKIFKLDEIFSNSG